MLEKPPYVATLRPAVSHPRLAPLDAPKLRIAIHPGDQSFRENLIFDPSWIINSGWCDSICSLRDLARSQGIDMGTADIVPMDQADLILFINLPASRQVVEQVRIDFPRARLVLIASESPVVQPHAAVRANHRLFDRVFLSCPPSGETKKYLRLPPGCAFRPDHAPPAIPFGRRRFAVLVNSNMNTGLLRSSRPWHLPRQALTIRSGGWSLPLERLLHVSLRSRYHCRRSFARAAESLGIDAFDIYGRCWEPLRSGWFHRWFPESPWRHWRGTLQQDKLHTLCHYRYAFCYENYAGDEGYISEKIFDALAAGTVPLCLGDRSLRRWIPSDCAVFREDYSSDRALLEDLLSWDEDRWQACREAGQRFLHSDLITPFLAEAYASQVLQGLKAAMEPSS
jgi:hypothetical protein